MEPNNLDLKEGKFLVRLARKSVENGLGYKKLITEKNKIPEKLKQKRGIFVTIKTYKQELRGCIGFIFPTSDLYESVQEAARHAAFSDPRFTPIKQEELNEILFEVSILTKPELIEVKETKEYLKKIEIGKDGLIIEAEPFKGLLLPNVAVEQKWNTEQFLNHTCLKANLLEETWKEGSCKIYKFQTQIFKEKSPNGPVIKI